MLRRVPEDLRDLWRRYHAELQHLLATRDIDALPSPRERELDALMEQIEGAESIADWVARRRESSCRSACD